MREVDHLHRSGSVNTVEAYNESKDCDRPEWLQNEVALWCILPHFEMMFLKFELLGKINNKQVPE